MYNKKERKQMKKVDLNNINKNPKTDEERIESEVKKLAFSRDPKKYSKIMKLLNEAQEKEYITEKQYKKHMNNLNFALDGVEGIKEKGKIILDKISKKMKSKINKIKGEKKWTLLIMVVQ